MAAGVLLAPPDEDLVAREGDDGVKIVERRERLSITAAAERRVESAVGQVARDLLLLVLDEDLSVRLKEQA